MSCVLETTGAVVAWAEKVITLVHSIALRERG